MECNKNCYLPQPPRAWSRVQNSCSLITQNTDGLVNDPLTGKLIPVSLLANRIAMFYKGNVLQYKANSSNLTKSQRYSKIAKGQWTNRNTSWATQSTRGYTNPNTSSLKRSGNVVNIAIDPNTGLILGETTDQPTCPTNNIPVNPSLPSNGGGGSDVNDPEIPPPINPSPGSDTFPNIIPDVPIEPIVIQDGGSLICSVQENICTGETKTSLSQQQCNLTTDSDVPGSIQELCWNDGTQTWYPRQRYVMTNSGNKWPTNAELSSSIKPYPPIITSISIEYDIITLFWIHNNDCLPASQFFIYQNDVLIQIKPGTEFTTSIVVTSCGIYSYFIIAGTTGNVISEPSNVVEVDADYVNPPTDLSYNFINSDSIELTWNQPVQDNNCSEIDSYNVYNYSEVLIGNTTNLSFIVSGLTNCNTYEYYVSAINVNNVESSKSSINVNINYITAPTNLSYSTTGSGTINLTWDASTDFCGQTIYYNVYKNNVFLGSTSNTNYTVSTLTNCSSYTFSVSAVDDNGNESVKTDLNNVVPLWPNPPTNLSYNTIDSGVIELNWNIPNPNCSTAVSYNIYMNNVYIANTTNLYYDVSGLTNCSSYTFSVSSLNSNSDESTKSVLNNVVPLWPNPPSNFTGTWLSPGKNISLNWNDPSPNCDSPTSYNIYYSSDNITFTEISNIPSTSNTYNFTFTDYGTYYFYMNSVSGSKTSNSTNTINVSANLFTVTGGSYSTTSQINGSTTTYNIVVYPGTTTLQFITLPDSSRCNFELVGAGGGGGGAWNNLNFNEGYPFYSGAGGGGGGNALINNFIVDTNNYTIKVGSGGNGGLIGYDTTDATSGSKGGNTSVVGTGINCVANGGNGGDKGADNNRADGGSGGGVTINTLSSGTQHTGSGGTGGQGNAGRNGSGYNSGTDGSNGYFYNNQALSYSPSTSYPTYYAPSTAYTPPSQKLTHWYQVSGGGGGGNGTSSNSYEVYQGGSGRGSGGLDGGNYPYVASFSNPSLTPYPSFGGGGGGGGIYSDGFNGGNGLTVIWFSYTT